MFNVKKIKWGKTPSAVSLFYKLEWKHLKNYPVSLWLLKWLALVFEWWWLLLLPLLLLLSDCPWSKTQIHYLYPRTMSGSTDMGPEEFPMCLQSWCHRRGMLRWRAIQRVVCSRCFPHITAFHLHYQIISKPEKPGCLL